MDDPRGRTSTLRYSISSLFRAVHEQDADKGDLLASKQSELSELKREIAISSKRNFNVEKDVSALDQKIALLIKNRITLEEVMASSGDINNLLLQRTTTIKDKREREHYGQLFHLLQRETLYIATLARLVKLGEIDNLLQTVMFTLYGNQYDDEEEHLLLTMFQKVLHEEVQEATTINTLMRANTALTRMMTTYTRRGPGQTYLKNTLTSVLNEILQKDGMILEINPVKVYENYIIEYETKTGQTCPLPKKPTPEEAAATPEIQKIVKERLLKLDEIANRFIDALINSLNTVPYGIRWICKQIHDLVREKFPQGTREQVISLIGGFYLLRFVNPAVVTPQTFMMVDTKLSANSRRNLTLLAKILQNLANNTQFGGLKEAYMAPLNNFLENVRVKFNNFLEDLTKVDDLDEHLQFDKYLRLGKTGDISIHISLNEMYFIHGLLLEHVDVLQKKTQDPILKEILTELGPAPPQLPRKDNSNVDLVLIPRYQKRDDNKESKPDILYTETKLMLFTIIRGLPQLEGSIEDINSLLEQAEKYAMDRKDSKLAEKIKKTRANCKQLVSLGVLQESDKYAKLRKDTVQEILHYEEQIRKTTADMERLKGVLKNISDHHQYLTLQYETYKQYLENVRESCTTSSSKKDTKKREKEEKKRGPVKFSHQKLMQDGIIIESEVPEERRGNIFFQFSSVGQGQFNVAVMYKSRTISDMKIQLDDLLEKQHNNNLELETDFLKLNINLLIFLLNKNFMS